MATSDANESLDIHHREPHPLDSVGVFGSMWFTWLNPFIEKNNQTSFEQWMQPNPKPKAPLFLIQLYEGVYR